MMDAGVVGLGAGSDPASVSKSSVKSATGDNADGNGGFQDVLSSHENGRGSADRDAVAKPADNGGSLDEHGVDQPKLKRGNWMQEGPLAGLGARDQLQAAEIQKRYGSAGLDRSDTAGTTASDSEGVKDDLTQFLAAKGSQVKTGKKADGGADELKVQADEVGEAAAGKGEGTLGDVLSLLNGAGAASAGAAVKAGTNAGRSDSGHQAVRGDVGGDPMLRHSGDKGVLPEGGADDAISDAGRTFRFARTDGRGQTMDMTISGGRDDRADLTTRSGGTGQAETVTVLDARRYLGFTQGTNAGAVINGLSSDAEWHGAMQSSSALSNAAAWTSTGKVVNTLKIQMNPIELGLVTATMRLRGEELTVELTVETRAAYRQLAEDQRKIVDALKAQGFAVDQVTIALSNVDRSEAATNQNGSQGAFNQQASQGGEGGGNAAEGGASDTGGQQGRNKGLATDDTAADKQVGAATVSGGGRPGHVYI